MGMKCETPIQPADFYCKAVTAYLNEICLGEQANSDITALLIRRSVTDAMKSSMPYCPICEAIANNQVLDLESAFNTTELR
jgi:hypothetical protein